MTLKYLRQYVTQKEMAYEFEIGEATVHDTIVWVENILIKNGTFSLPRRKRLLEDDRIEIVLVDVTECPVERPQKTTKILLRKEEKTHIKDTVGYRQEDTESHLFKFLQWKET